MAKLLLLLFCVVWQLSFTSALSYFSGYIHSLIKVFLTGKGQTADMNFGWGSVLVRSLGSCSATKPLISITVASLWQLCRL